MLSGPGIDATSHPGVALPWLLQLELDTTYVVLLYLSVCSSFLGLMPQRVIMLGTCELG